MKKITLFVVVAVAAMGLAGCSSLEGKSVGIASNLTGLKIETTGSASTGTLMPNIMTGTAQNAIATAPALDKDKSTQVVVAYGETSSWFGDLFGLDTKTRTFAYVGKAGETAEETKSRLDAVAKVLTSTSNKTEAPAATSTGAGAVAPVAEAGK